MNKNNKIIKLLIILVILAAILVSPVYKILAGDFIDHGGDWGGDDSSSSSDYGSDDDYSGSGSGSGGSGSDSDGSIFFVAIIVIIIIILVVRAKNKGSGGNSFNSTPLQMSDTSSVDEASLAKLRERDPLFSEAAMLSKVENLFMTMQLAWCKQNYEPVRPFLSNALFEQQAKQLKDKVARDEKNVSSEIAVLQSKLESYSTDGHNEYLNVWMRIKMKDYLVKISDPTKIISGDTNRTYHLDFRWQMTRSAGGITDAATDAVKTGECPSCGANININQSGKCQFCGAVVSTTEYDWVLAKIDALQQRSR